MVRPAPFLVVVAVALLGEAGAFSPPSAPRGLRSSPPAHAPSASSSRRALPLLPLLRAAPRRSSRRSSTSSLRMASSPPPSSSSKLDPVTYLRTEWVAAALCTNQTPRSADVCLQLGCEDGRVVNFLPRTVREIVTSSAEPDGAGLTASCERQLKQMAERRGAAKVTYSDQPADDLRDTPSSSVDVVVSLQAARRMAANGLDWRASLQEAGRVLKPGGRLLFVEARDVDDGTAEGGGGGYLDAVLAMSEEVAEEEEGSEGDGEEDDEDDDVEGADGGAGKPSPVFAEVGYDAVDMVLQPHVAGVAIKASDADLTPEEKRRRREEEERDALAERSLEAFERGNKGRRRRKKKNKKGGMGGGDDEE